MSLPCVLWDSNIHGPDLELELDRSVATARRTRSPYSFLVVLALLCVFPSRMRIARPANAFGSESTTRGLFCRL